MLPTHSRALLFILFCTLVCPIHSVHAEASINVSPVESFYRDIDKLVAHKLIHTHIRGQRPFSRREFARLAQEAAKNFSQKKPWSEKSLTYIQTILDRLHSEFAEEIEELKSTNTVSFHPIANSEFHWVTTDSPYRPISDNGVGRIDSLFNPLLQPLMGRHLVEGTTAAIETSSWLRLTDHMAFHFVPRVQLALDSIDDVEANIFVENLYAKFLFKNIELEIGRDNILWGQGEKSTLLLSASPRALDLVKLSNDKPFHFPWIFEKMGPQRMSFIYADLGPEQGFPHTYLASWKWSMLPLPFLELGLNMGVHSGGEGSPDGSFLDRFADIIPAAHLFAGSQQEIGNKIGGGDFNLRLPFFRNTSVYGELFFDDIKGDIKTQFVDVAAYLFGAYLPRLTDSGLVDLRFEFHQIGEVFYRHAQFLSGWSLNQQTLGDPLGPNAQGFYLTANWDISSHNKLESSLALETTSGDIFQAVYPVGSNSSFQKIIDSPEETRYRFTATWSHRFKKHDFMQFHLKGGYERVKNFNFSAGSSLDNFLGLFVLSIQPEKIW